MHQNAKSTAAMDVNQVIALCKVAGIHWTPKASAGSVYPREEGDCFKGPISMEQMTNLLTAASTFAASTEELIAGQRAALDSHYATREQIIEALHAATDGPSRIAAVDKVLTLLCAQPAPAFEAPTTPDVTQALDDLESYFNRESIGFAKCQLLREAMAVGYTRVQVHNSALESAMAISKASHAWADVDAMRALKRPTSNEAAAGSPEEGALALDAARWRAVMGSAYLRPIGNAGLTTPMANNYAHLGLELWTRFDPAAGEEDLTIENERARGWLTKYADIARATQAQPQPAGAALDFTA